MNALLRAAVLAGAALAGCAADVHRAVSPGMAATEVSARVGRPTAEGHLANDDLYWDYSSQPYGFYVYRVTFGTDGKVRDVRNLLTEANFAHVKPGMARKEVAAIVGPGAGDSTYWNGTSSWTYRYLDIGTVKLWHVIFDPEGRVLTHFWEWDPRVYSGGDGIGGRH